MQEFFETEFWFYSANLSNRAGWWNIELGKKCLILPKVYFKKSGRYFTFSHLSKLRRNNPDIVMIGGLSIPANYIAYLWAKRNKKKVVLFTERSRDHEGNLRKYDFFWKILRFAYRKIDLVMVSADDAKKQFQDEFRFGSKVVTAQYPSDLDAYFKHKVRSKKEGNVYTLLFANRLTEIYDPLMAIDVFFELHQKFPNVKMEMNAVGELRGDCEKQINLLGIQEKVKFLDDIQSWDELNEIYQAADIMFLPARFSNGNFTILEAMASGMGIVISENVLGVGELINDGINGFKCFHEKQEYLRRILEYILNPDNFAVHSEINKAKVTPLGMAETAKMYNNLFKENLE